MHLLLVLAQIAIPAPRGYVNDFAGVLDPAAVRRMEALITEVRDKTRGEIAVVTLPDLGDRAPADVAVQIGRQWGVGAKGEAGDPAKNLGVVVLLVPRRNHRPGTGKVFIATGRGAEGFLPDARVGRIREAMSPYFAREDYSGGLEEGVALLAQAFADEFGVTLVSEHAPAPPERPGLDAGQLAKLVFILAIALVIIATRATRARQRREGWRWLWMGGGWGGAEVLAEGSAASEVEAASVAAAPEGVSDDGQSALGGRFRDAPAGRPRWPARLAAALRLGGPRDTRPGTLRREYLADLRRGGRAAVRGAGAGPAELAEPAPADPHRGGVAPVGGCVPDRVR